MLFLVVPHSQGSHSKIVKIANECEQAFVMEYVQDFIKFKGVVMQAEAFSKLRNVSKIAASLKLDPKRFEIKPVLCLSQVS